MVAVIKGTPTVSRWKVFSSMASGHLNLSRQWVTSFEPLERMEDEISGPGPLLPPLKTRPGTKSQLATLSSFSDRPIFLARCTLPMRLRSHAPLAREILLELLWRWPETKKRPFVAWKKINRRKWREGCESRSNGWIQQLWEWRTFT